MPKPNSTSERRLWPDHQTIWRWHFYAGLICVPFVLWLSVTGSIYLFKPQIERWLDRPYDHLSINGPLASPAAQAQAALAAVPGSVLNTYELPHSPRAATQVLVGQDTHLLRVYVHPQTLQVLHVVDEDKRFMRTIFQLHGELMQGDRGSMIVETAASWAIVMLITGIYLWWPGGTATLAGVLYPRLRSRGRVFWRDLHSVTGLWVSLFALFLLVSGLPWAKSWGSMLKEVRRWGSTPVITQDWTTGRSSELAQRQSQNAQAASGEHAGHHLAAAPAHAQGADYTALNRLLPVIQAAQLAHPVLITPPSQASAAWTARSDTQNRPRRVTLQLDAATGTVMKRQAFADRPLMDRVVGVGVAAHEGQLFAPLNQALGLLTALGLQILSISALVLWWRRRPEKMLGAPAASTRRYAPWPLLFIVVTLSVVLPLLGATLIFVLGLERWVLRRIKGVVLFLGLQRQ
jgi:uncharacterized iron-regulated membrane protein